MLTSCHLFQLALIPRGWGSITVMGGVNVQGQMWGRLPPLGVT